MQDLNLLHSTLHPEEDIGQVEGTNTSKAMSHCHPYTKFVLVPAQRCILGKRVYITLWSIVKANFWIYMIFIINCNVNS